MVSVPYFSDDFKLLIERNVSNWCFWISAFHKNVSPPLLNPLPFKISDWVLGTWPWRTLPGTQLPEHLGRKSSLCCGHARRGADAGFQRSRAHPRESTRSRGSVNTGQGHAHLWRCFQGPRQMKFRAPVHCCELDCVVQQRNLSDAALLSHECARVKWACWREPLTVRAAGSSWTTSNSCCAECLHEPSRLCLVLCSRRGPLRDNLLFFKQLHWEIIHTRYNLPIKVYNSLCNKHISIYFQVCDPTISLRTCLSARLHVFLIYWQARSVSPQSSAQPSPREPLTGFEPPQPCQFRPFHRHGVRGQVPFAMGGISTWLSIYPCVSQWIFGLSHFFPVRNNPAMKTHSPVWRCFFHFSWVSNWEWNCYVTL